MLRIYLEISLVRGFIFAASTFLGGLFSTVSSASSPFFQMNPFSDFYQLRLLVR